MSTWIWIAAAWVLIPATMTTVAYFSSRHGARQAVNQLQARTPRKPS